MAHKSARYTELSESHRMLIESVFSFRGICLETGFRLNEPKSNNSFCNNIICSRSSSLKIPSKSGYRKQDVAFHTSFDFLQVESCPK